MWDFAKTSDPTMNGISDSGILTFRDEESLMRELIQNSLDAKKEECDKVKVKIKMSEKETNKFPYKEELEQVVKECLKTYEYETNAIKMLKKSLNYLNNEKHVLLSYSDMNTKGLQGTRNDKQSTFAQLIYGNGSTNKNQTTSTGGSFGLGKNAPFVKAGVRTLLYETYNVDGIDQLIGKAKLTSHETDGEMRSANGYLVCEDDDIYETVFEYLKGNTLPRGETGTGIHIPFYMFSDDMEDETIKNKITREYYKLTYDIIENFMVAIYEGKLEVEIADKIIDNKKLEYLVQNIDSTELKKKRKDNIKAMYNALVNGKRYNFILGDQIGCTFYLALDEKATGNNKTYFMREQLMLIQYGNEKRFLCLLNKYDAVCIFEGEKINNILREAEPQEHNKWDKKNLGNKGDKQIFANTFEELTKIVKKEISKKLPQELILKEFNNNFITTKKEKNQFFEISKKVTEKKVRGAKETSSEVKASFINGTEQVIDKSIPKNKLVEDEKGTKTTKGISKKNRENPVRKVRNIGQGKTKFFLSEKIDANQLEVYNFNLYVRTEEKLEKVETNFKVDSISTNDSSVIITHNEGNVSLVLQLEEKNETL